MSTFLILIPTLAPLLSAVPAELIREQDTQALVGLWGCTQSFGPTVRGRLVIDGRQLPWVAHIAGFDLTNQQNGETLSFTLPGGQGEFRGTLAADGRASAATGSSRPRPWCDIPCGRHCDLACRPRRSGAVWSAP